MLRNGEEEEAVSNTAARGRGEAAGSSVEAKAGFGNPGSKAPGARVEDAAEGGWSTGAAGGSAVAGPETEERAEAEAEAKPMLSAEMSSFSCIEAPVGGRRCQKAREGRRFGLIRKAWNKALPMKTKTQDAACTD